MRGEWITLDEAERRELDLSLVADSIGPRRAGTVYLNGYWGTVDTVTRVMVKVYQIRDTHTPVRRVRKSAAGR